MASFILDGETYEYLRPDPEQFTGGHPFVDVWAAAKGRGEPASSWGGTVEVYAHADRWNPSQILANWLDDERHVHWSWVPAGNVRRVTDSEWDIE